MGIEPTRDDTRLSGGFEDRGAHQLPFRPRTVFRLSYYISEKNKYQHARLKKGCPHPLGLNHFSHSARKYKMSPDNSLVKEIYQDYNKRNY